MGGERAQRALGDRASAAITVRVLLEQQVAAVLAFSRTGTNGDLIVGAQTAETIERLSRALSLLDPPDPTDTTLA